MAAPEPKRSSRIQEKAEAAKAALAKIEEAAAEEKKKVAEEELMKLAILPQLKLSEQEIPADKKAKYQKNLTHFESKYARFLDEEKKNLKSDTYDAILKLFDISTTELALTMFGPQNVAAWMTLYEDKKVRGIFELTSLASTQCNKTVKEVKLRETECWICGMPIWEAGSTLPAETDNGHSPECEHILPIAQAALFLQIYDRANSSSELFKLEYAWSHKTCNQTKNADVYFQKRDGKIVRGRDKLPIIDDVKYNALLTHILSGKRSDSDVRKDGDPPPPPPAPQGTRPEDFLPHVDPYCFTRTLKSWIQVKYPGPGSTARWRTDRIKVFREKYQAILNFIGGHAYQMSPTLYILSLAGAAAHIVEGHKPKQVGVLYGQTFSPPIPDTPPAADQIPLTAPDEELPQLEHEEFQPISETDPRKIMPNSITKLLELLESEAESDTQPADSQMSQEELDEEVAEETAEERAEAEELAKEEADLKAAEEAEEEAARAAVRAAARAAAPVAAAPKRAADTAAEGDSTRRKTGGGRTRRRTRSFLPHNRRRSHHAIKMSSKRHSP
jgi:hypothetical protein